MNIRIKELAKQAGYRYYPSSNSGPLRVEYLTPELEKFAELIILECVLQCNEALVPYTGQPSMTHNYAVGLCQDKIKEHFGVEE